MEKRYSNALTPLSQIIFSSDYFFQSFCNIWVSVTPSHNSFTISPHNLALLHSTLLHSYLALLHSTLLHSYPVPLSLTQSFFNNQFPLAVYLSMEPIHLKIITKSCMQHRIQSSTKFSVYPPQL